MGKFTKERRKSENLPGEQVLYSSQTKCVGEHLLQNSPRAAVPGEDKDCGNEELDISTTSENRNLLIDESKGLLIFAAEFNTS